MPPSFVYSLETKDIILKQLENSKALDVCNINIL